MPVSRRSARRLVQAASFVLGFATVAQGQTFNVTWVGASGTGGDGNWELGSNWSGGVRPESLSGFRSVFIDGGKPASSTVRLNSSADEINALTIDAGDRLLIEGVGNLTVEPPIGATIFNAGTIEINASGAPAGLTLRTFDNVSLAGGGAVTLSNSANNRIVNFAGGNDRLINQDNTISGGGRIGNLVLTNRGMVVANQPVGLELILGNFGTPTNVNSGVMRADAGSTLTIRSEGSIQNFEGAVNGLIRANGTGSHVFIDHTAIVGGTVDLIGASELIINLSQITGGTITNSSTGVIHVFSDTLGGVVSNPAGGLITVGFLRLLGGPGNSYNNAGLIDLPQESDPPVLHTLEISAGEVVHSGGGSISVGTGNLVSIDPGSTLNFNGTMSGPGQLQLAGASDLVLNTGTVTTGSLTNSSAGIIHSLGLTSNRIGGGVNNPSGGQIVLDNATTLTLVGGLGNSYDNRGIISLNSSGSATELRLVGGDVTIGGAGGGVISLSNQTTNRVVGATSDIRLTLVNQNLFGAGQVGIDKLLLTNRGVINANLSNGITVDPSGTSTSLTPGMINTGLMVAGATSRLTLLDGRFENFELAAVGSMLISGGSVLQVQNSTVSGGTVQLLSGELRLSNGSVTGGTLTNGGAGIIRSVASTNNIIGGAVTNPGGGPQIIVEDGSELRALGGVGNSYDNGGLIRIDSTGLPTLIKIDGGNVLLKGGGNVRLSDQPANRITGALGTEQFINQDNVISGAGKIDALAIINRGTIRADLSNDLIVDANAVGFANEGLLDVKPGSTLKTIDGYLQTAGNTHVNGTLNSTGLLDITGGLVSGNGLINGNISNGGTITPGDSIDQLDVVGDVVFTPGGTYFVELGTAGISDRTDITGLISLATAGDVLSITGGSFAETYIVATFGTRLGTFDVVTPGYNVVYDDVLRQIRIQPVPEPAAMLLVSAALILQNRRRRFNAFNPQLPP